LIESLTVSGLALIEAADVDLGPGLTAVTGETGAGKTMLVEALNLAVGERADSGLVRDGAEDARVSVVWVRGGGQRSVFERRVARDGRNRASIDGRQVNVSALAEAAEGLVDLHGQHEHQRLLHQKSHADYLDRFVGEAALEAREAFRGELERARKASRGLADADAALADRERHLERLRIEIAEIEDAAPVGGEDEELAARLPVLRHAEQLGQAVGEAYEALESAEEAVSGVEGALGPEPALEGLRRALAALDAASAYDEALIASSRRLQAALTEIQDVSHEIREYLDSIDRDPLAYERAEERAHVLHRLGELYGGSAAAALDHLARARESLETIEGGDERRAELARELDEALAGVAAHGRALSALRREAAPRLAEAVQAAARALAMPHARFVVDMAPIEAPGCGADLADVSGDGLDRVEFLFSANEGEAVRSLGRVASGGELSRLMLATKTVLGAADTVGTLVFDEIDAGIGGHAAVAVAAALRRLAHDRQVLVITHLPQIAAVADHNLVVTKEVESGRTLTRVARVEGDALESELARMLSGDTASDASRLHARELLARRATP